MNEHMTLRHKQILAALVCCLSVCFALWSCSSLYMTPETDRAVQAVDSKQAASGPKQHITEGKTASRAGRPAGAGKPGVRRELTGLEQAAKTTALRDPFTPQHETAAEVAAVLAYVPTGDEAAGTDAVAVKAQQPAQAQGIADNTGGKAAVAGALPLYTPPVLRLQGCVTSERGSMALLSDGQHTAAVAPGEWFAGWYLVAVGSEGAELANDSGALHLDYVHF